MTEAIGRVTPPPFPSPSSTRFTSTGAAETRAALGRFLPPMTVLEPDGAAGFEVSADVIRLGPLTVAHLSFRRPAILEASGWAAYRVTAPTAGRVDVSQPGHETVVDITTAAVFCPGAAARTRYPAGSAAVDVTVERYALEAELGALLSRDAPGRIELSPVMDLAAAPGRSWRRMLEMLRDEAGHPTGLAHHPLVAEQLWRAVLRGLLLSVPHRHLAELSAPATAGPPRAIRRVVDLIETEPERPFSVADLAAVAGVSVRSLQEGFRRHVGCTPMAYLQQVRLGRAHDALRGADPSQVTVAAVAHRWGFAHLGRFAGVYRARYGCSPSRTLRQG